jgi:hypothetical protein
MKTFVYGSALMLAAVLSLPATVDAFSRRSSSWEIGPQNVTAPVQATTNSPQSVPEPPVLLLMTVAVGVFGLGYAIRKVRKQS